MLMDKGYYDYDYSKPQERQTHKAKPKSKEELGAVMARFGFKTKLRSSSSTPLSPAELQAEVMREEKLKQERR